MAAQDKIASLTTYVQNMKDRLQGETDPSRRKWLEKEVSFHQKKLDTLKMSGQPADKK